MPKFSIERKGTTVGRCFVTISDTFMLHVSHLIATSYLMLLSTTYSLTSINYVLTYYPLCLLKCRAATKDLHSCLFWASVCLEPQVWCRVFISLSTVLRQVFLGLPFLHLPSGVQWRAVRVMLFCSLRITCPIHFHRLLIMMVATLSCLHWLSRSWMEMVLGQNILFIFRRLLVWKVDSLWRSFLVILQHSEPYNRGDRTQLWHGLSLVLALYRADFQTLFSLCKVFWALLSRLVMSLPALPSWLETMLLR